MIWLWWHGFVGAMRLHRLRTLVQVLAIAVGVALGYAVSLVNHAALSEFSSALRSINGEPDGTVAGSRAGFPEALFGQVGTDPDVAVASPVLETDVLVLGTEATRPPRLLIVGLDVLRAAHFSTALLPLPAGDGGGRFALFDDGIYLSPAALERFGVKPKDRLRVQAGDRVVELAVAGTLPGARPGSLVGVMDLGYAQWRLLRLGRLTRIDLRLREGRSLKDLATRLELPAGVALSATGDETGRLANLSRSYRINLNVLALVALFTGSFLVFSLQAQAVLARRWELAWLRVAGVTRTQLQGLLLAEAAALGVAGSAAGLLMGAALARAALNLVGGDLGGGYFGTLQPALQLPPAATVGFAALGVVASSAGAWLPAREAARATLAPALHPGAEEDALLPLARGAPGLAALLAAAVLVWLPPVNGIPLPAYLAIGCLLVGVIALQPRIAAAVFRPLARRLTGNRFPLLLLAANRLARAPGGAAIAMAGIVASFGLMVAMSTMVTSFRVSLEDWLQRVLPADLYVRVGQFTTDTWFPTEDLQRLAGHPSVRRAEFSRTLPVQLAPDRAPVTVVVRALTEAEATKVLPLTGPPAPPEPEGLPPAWVSEAMVDLYDAQPGAVLTLPLAGRRVPFRVAGVWRDYARQFGSVVVRAEDYERFTGDHTRSDAALWLKDGADAQAVGASLKELLASREGAEINSPAAIRALSLRIFDRSFAITYVLTLAAILIGMIGVAATFAAQAMARTREFGMLRHVGVTRGQVLRILALESGLATGNALLMGLCTGLVIAVVLIRVVNRQSFHWSMDFQAPWPLIGLMCAVLLAAAVLTAALAGRRVAGLAPLRAVHEDS